MEGTAAPATATPWRWVPSLYFSQGIPNAVATTLVVVLLKNLGVSNADIALSTSWLYLPWVIKPLWAPFVDLTGTKRRWILAMQSALGLALAGIAFTLPVPEALRWVLAWFWLVTFASATHDIAADGFYLLALPPHQQAAFVGVRSTCFRVSLIAVKGGLVWLAGRLMTLAGGPAAAWSVIFGLLAAWFLAVALLHARTLPRPAADVPVAAAGGRAGFLGVFAAFFRKEGILAALGFMLCYRLPEALALRLIEPFLLDARAVGGLGLGNQQLGLAYGTVGTAALLGGGLLGGYLISRHGLRRLLWPMAAVMHLPIALFLLLAWRQPDSLPLIAGAIALEQFGYGFGFTSYMVYLMMFAAGAHRTAHYALCTGFMALGIMLPGLKAGWLQEQLGYVNFFGFVCATALVSFAVTALIKVDPAFGRKA